MGTLQKARAIKSILFVILLFCSFTLLSAEMTGEIDSLNAKGYDVVVDFTSNSSGNLTAQIEAKDEKNNIEVKIELKNITISKKVDNKTTVIATQKVNIANNKKGSLGIHRRGASLGISVNNALVFRAADIERGPGKIIAVNVNKWKNNSANVYTLDPVYFTDDFMRDSTTDDDGNWENLSGEWHLRSAWDNDPHVFATSKNMAKKLSGGQNPFEWLSWGNPAISIVGNEEWEDYIFKCAFRADMGSTFGIITNYRDEKNYVLATITSATDKTSGGNKITLYQILKGKKSTLGESYGGYIPNQWYALSVESSISGVRVFLDGQERVNAKNLELWYGKAGLYTVAETPIEIDDISILGKDLDYDTLHEINTVQIASRFVDDKNGMEVWARSGNEWESSNNLTGINLNYRYYSRDVHGNKQWMVMDINPTLYATGKLNLMLCGVKGSKDLGYRVEMDTVDNETTVFMYQNKELLATKTLKTPTVKPEKITDDMYFLPSTLYTLRLLKEDDTLRFEINDEDILTAKIDLSQTMGSRPAYQSAGRYLSAKNVMALTYNLIDYTFTSAPTDWFGEGTWEASTRWACDPEWSFLAGYSNGDVALWNKNIVEGDQTFQAYLGIKMEYPREYNTYYERYRELNISICTDGQNPMTGYSGVYGSKDKRMILYRNGKEVASQTLTGNDLPNGGHHRLWFDVQLEKKGNKITFSGNANVNGKPVTVSFEDGDPIEGGVPVIWSNNNAISIARARISYEKEPISRPGPFVVVDMPWHPEFISVGTPLTLTLPTVSTSGKNVELVIEQKIVPTDAKNKPSAVKLKDNTITFSPNFNGLYQYKINGKSDGVTSPSVYLDTYVFDPTPGNRTTTNVLAQYDFTDGQGNIIHDRSGYGEPLNLKIAYKTTSAKDANGKTIEVDTKDLSAQWIQGQGIAVDSISKVISENPADKLLEIKKDNRMTIEMWLSLNTIYPENIAGADQWTCSFLELNDPSRKDFSKRWFTFMQNGGVYYFGGMTGDRYRGDVAVNSTRTGLQHVVISYNPDDKLTYVYRNGKLLEGGKSISWNFDKWTEGAYLILGNAILQINGNPALAAAFSGNIYYLSIYNHTFTATQAADNYKSGPKI